MKNLNVTYKMLIGFSLVILLAIALTQVQYSAIKDTSNMATIIASQHMPVLEDTVELERSIRRASMYI